MDKMLKKLKEEESRFVQVQMDSFEESNIELSSEIDIEGKLKDGYVKAEAYKMLHK